MLNDNGSGDYRRRRLIRRTKKRIKLIIVISIIMASFSWFSFLQPVIEIVYNPPVVINGTLAVVSACIPGPRFNAQFIDASFSNKQYFCDKWGAECILSKQPLQHSTPDGTAPSSVTATKLKKYSPKWEKLYLLNRTLYTTTAQWILWLDCDAAFTNFDIHWTKQLHNYLDTTKVLIASKDSNGTVLYLGVFLLPNTNESKLFINNLWKERHAVEQSGLFHKDQNALKFVLRKFPQYQSSIIDTVPQQLLNSYLLHSNNNNTEGHIEWTQGDWIVHQVFCEYKICTTQFLSLLQSVKPRQ
jgi:hypothetical protein